MKRRISALLAVFLLFDGASAARAVDFKARGEWIFEFGYTDGLHFAKSNRSAGNPPAGRSARYGNGNGADNFNAVQRLRLELDMVASESLTGQVFFEIGTQKWGTDGAGASGAARDSGGALGTDGVSIAVRRAFIDWFAPDLPLRVRMGLQGMALPSYSFESGVFNDDAAGVIAAWFFNKNVHLSVFWIRPFNDNFAGSASDRLWTGNVAQPSGSMDNIDAFGTALPLLYDSFKISPWFALAGVGPNTLSTPNSAGLRQADVTGGIGPALWRTGATYGWSGPAKRNRDYALAMWAGLPGEITVDPFRIAWDINYGSLEYAKTTYRNRTGWIANVLAEYSTEWGVPGVYAWWGSGDDGDPTNGSERIPVFATRNSDLGLSSFGFSGAHYSGVSDGVSLGLAYAGGWGVGARVRDLSFVEDLKHTLRLNLFGGANDPQMAKYITGKKQVGNDGRAFGRAWSDFNSGAGEFAGVYLTRQDYGMEVNLDTTYKVHEHLDIMLELGYIHLWLDQSRAVWGAGFVNGDPSLGAVRGVRLTDAVKASVLFRYSF